MSNNRRAGSHALQEPRVVFAPRTVAYLLKTMHEQSRVERYTLIVSLRTAIAENRSKTPMLAIFVETNLATTLIDILRDVHVYDRLLVDPIAVTYLGTLLESTDMLLRFLVASFCANRANNNLKDHLLKVFEHSVGIWDTMWTPRPFDYLVDQNKTDTAKRLCERFTRVLLIILEMAMLAQGMGTLLLSKYWHIALLLWLGNPTFSLRTSLIEPLKMIMSFTTAPLRAAYVKEAILDPRLEKAVLAQCASDMPQLEHSFEDYLAFITILCEEPEMKRARAEVGILPQAVMSATRRQICSGTAEHMTDALLGAVGLICDIYLNDMEPSKASLASVWGSYDLTTLLAKCALACTQETVQRIDRVHLIRDICALYKSQWAESDDADAKADMAAAVTAVWQPTVHALLKWHTSRARPDVHGLFSVWFHFADDIRQSIEQQSILSYFNEQPPGHKGCHSIRCLCYGSRPCHTMRICKGCSEARYCSKRCQKEDWRDHRATCRANRPSD